MRWNDGIDFSLNDICDLKTGHTSFLLSGDRFQRARYESPDFGKLGAKTVGLTCRLQTASSYAFPQR